MNKLKTSPSYTDGFNNYARNPYIWLFESRCQMTAANTLFDRFEQTLAKGRVEERSGCYRAAMFHAGLAIENAAKAALIKRDPIIIQNKKIDFKKYCGKGGHDLLKCVKNVLDRLSQEEERLLRKLQQFVIWAGKYALPLYGSVLDDDHLRQEMRLVGNSDRMLIGNVLKRLTDLVNAKNE